MRLLIVILGLALANPAFADPQCYRQMFFNPGGGGGSTCLTCGASGDPWSAFAYKKAWVFFCEGCNQLCSGGSFTGGGGDKGVCSNPIEIPSMFNALKFNTDVQASNAVVQRMRLEAPEQLMLLARSRSDVKTGTGPVDQSYRHIIGNVMPTAEFVERAMAGASDQELSKFNLVSLPKGQSLMVESWAKTSANGSVVMDFRSSILDGNTRKSIRVIRESSVLMSEDVSGDLKPIGLNVTL